MNRVKKIDCKAKIKLQKGNKNVLGEWNLEEHGKVKFSENQQITSKGRQITQKEKIKEEIPKTRRERI